MPPVLLISVKTLCESPLFTEVRGRGILGRWLRGSTGGIMLVVKGDIPLSPKRRSPVTYDLIKERGPDESSNDRKSFWRIVPDHVYHRDPRIFFLRPCAGRPSLHRRCCRRPHQSVLWSVLGAAPHHREHRHRRRAVPDPQAPERNLIPWIRHRSYPGMRLHRRG